MTHHLKMSAIGLAFCTAGLLGAASSSWAASSVDAQYRDDVARCKSGASGQDQATCMREAGASLVERRRNGLSTPADPQRNASARCDALPAAQRQDCMIQMSGQANTTVQGSVAGGGILRETVIQTPAGTPGASPGYTTPGGGAGYTQPATPLAPPPAVPPAGAAPYGSPAPAPYGSMPRQ
jgi:hypothetical protein